MNARPIAATVGHGVEKPHDPPRYSLLVSIAVALATTAMSTGVRALLHPILGLSLPYLTFFGGVMAAAWFAGWRAGVLATVVSAVVTQYYFIAPMYSMEFVGTADQVGAAVFVCIGISISAFAEALHAARRDAVRQFRRLEDATTLSEELRLAAQEQGERLQQTLMSIGDGVIVTDRLGRVESMNPVAERLTGRTIADARQRDIATVLHLVDERQRRDVQLPVRQSIDEGRIIELTSPALLQHVDGHEIPIEDSAAPIRNSVGEVIGCVLVFRDVSERRTADAMVRSSESALATLFENANVGLRWIGPDGIVLRANDEELRMLGYERAEYEGHHIRDFHEDPTVVAAILSTFGSGQGLRGCATRMRCKDGGLKDVMINCTVELGGEHASSACCFTLDVSDRVAAERTHALLAAVVESSDDAIVTKGLDGIVTSWNAGAVRLFGYTPEEAIGQHITFIIPPERHQDEDRIIGMIGRGEFVPAFETMRRHKDGRLVPVGLSVSPVRDASGRVIGASKVARDISARIAMEGELREAARRKDEFLATLAHELRNPLAPMRHALHLMAALEPDSPKVTHVLGILTRQMDHMVRLIDDLMDISRIDRNKLVLRKSRVELATLVRQAVETVRPLINASRHTLTVELPDDTIALDVDVVRMTQVLTNILGNAVKFTNPGGVITLEARRERGLLRIAVTDNGIGIAPGRLDRVFDMFAQGHERQEDSRGGLGIGLTLVRRIVELHGGRADVTSAGSGAGTTALVELPLEHAGAVVSTAPALVTQAPHLADRRVLVVDDIHDNADTLAELLSLYGCKVTTTYDGDAAIDAFAGSPHDIVLLDLGMPRVSGFDVCRALRLLPGGPPAVVVALTGWGQDEDRRKTREAGFDGHLVKPIDSPSLLELLRELLATRADRRSKR